MSEHAQTEKKIAFVSYNALDLPSGWSQRGSHNAFVLQNTNGDGGEHDLELSPPERREQIGILWNELMRELPKLDQIVVYVGSRGSEKAIALSAQLPPEKVTYVGCSCGGEGKRLLITMAGMGDAGWINCECGGHHTMKQLYNYFMTYGRLHGPHGTWCRCPSF